MNVLMRVHVLAGTHTYVATYTKNICLHVSSNKDKSSAEHGNVNVCSLEESSQATNS